MTPETSRGTDQSDVRGIVATLAQAVREKDIERLLSLCADDVVVFDLLPPAQHRGADEVRKAWTTPLESLTGLAEYDVHQLEVVVSGDLAMCRSLNRFGGVPTEGKKFVRWQRMTLALQRIDSRWRIVHQHVSVPFDIKTGQALLELAP